MDTSELPGRPAIHYNITVLTVALIVVFIEFRLEEDQNDLKTINSGLETSSKEASFSWRGGRGFHPRVL